MARKGSEDNDLVEVASIVALSSRCPFCDSYIGPHCDYPWCKWIKCRKKTCNAFGTKDRFVLVKEKKA